MEKQEESPRLDPQTVQNLLAMRQWETPRRRCRSAT